jgi:putative FmdB family regulatory protein
MPIYTYRREDGTTFEIRQKFLDDPLTVDPESGQPVKRIVQATSIIFKGSGFYVTDSKGKSSTASHTDTAANGKDKSNGDHSKSESVTAEKSDKPAAESKPEPKAAEKSTPKASTTATAAAD